MKKFGLMVMVMVTGAVDETCVAVVVAMIQGAEGVTVKEEEAGEEDVRETRPEEGPTKAPDSTLKLTLVLDSVSAGGASSSRNARYAG